MLAAVILACASPIVHDGDTLRCPGGRALRLARIDAPELPNSPRCRRPGTRCPAAPAIASRDNLAHLAAAGRLRCHVVDASPFLARFQRTDRYGRPVVRCTVAGVDLGAAQLAGGFADRWPR